MHLANFPVAGLKHHAGMAYADAMEQGDSLTLIPEPTNAHDVLAIEVLHQGVKIGYVPRPVNQMIHSFWNQAWKVRATVASSGCATICLELEID